MARTPYSLNSYTGEAGAAYVAGSGWGSADTTITITGTLTGWSPLGTTGGWYLAAGYGTASEEKIYVPSGSWTYSNASITFSGVTRGFDINGAAFAQASGLICTPVITATDTSEANYLVSQTLGKVTTTISGQALIASGTGLGFSPILRLTQVNPTTSGTISASVGDIINLTSWDYNTTTVNLPAGPTIGDCILVNCINTYSMTINFTPQSTQSINGGSNGTTVSIPAQYEAGAASQILFVASSATTWVAIAAGTDLGNGAAYYDLTSAFLYNNGGTYFDGSINFHNTIVSGTYTSQDTDLWVIASGSTSWTLSMNVNIYHDVIKLVSNQSTGTITVSGTSGQVFGVTSLPPGGSVLYLCDKTNWNTIASYGTNIAIPGGLTVSGSLGVGPSIPYNTVVTSGVISVGGASFSDVNKLASFVSSGNNYNQVTVRNTTTGSLASSSFVANNNLATSGNHFAEFGINSSAFTGTGVFNTPNAGYFAVASGELGVGTYYGGGIHLVVSGNNYDSIVVSGNGTISISGTVNHNQSTIQNARIQKRVLLISGSSNGTPTYNTNNYDVLHIMYQTAAITSFTASGSGTPVDGDTFRISVMSIVSGIPLTFGTNFEASTTALSTTTVSGVRLDMGFFWNSETNKWRIMSVG